MTRKAGRDSFILELGIRRIVKMIFRTLYSCCSLLLFGRRITINGGRIKPALFQVQSF
jgi:hypothetical protein